MDTTQTTTANTIGTDTTGTDTTGTDTTGTDTTGTGAADTMGATGAGTTAAPGVDAPADTARTAAGTPSGPSFRLTRSRTDRMLGGVCGGLAETLGIDVTLLRVGVVALTVLGGGIGIPLYLAAWLIAPQR